MEKLNVLSLFDGISCGRLALERACIPVGNYYASEIDKGGIAVTAANFPDTIHIGDVTKVFYKNDTLSFADGTQYHFLPNGGQHIDLLIGGSPCQDLSSSGKGAGLAGDRSILFFEYARLLKEVRPKYFLLENVASMKKADKAIITETLGVEPIEINSRLLSAQNRRRLYWTNIPNVTVPEDAEIDIKSIIGDDWFCGSMRGRRINPETNTRDDYNYDIPIKQQIECRMDNKSNCLTTVEKDNVLVTEVAPRRPKDEAEWRWLTPEEYEQLQTIPVGYTDAVSDHKRKKLIGNGWTVDIIAHILKNIPTDE